MAVKRFYFFGSYSSAPAFRPFIMEVESDGNGEFTIPTTGGGYNYDVKTSDGQTFSGVTGNLTITFPSANTRYDIEISGDFPRIFFNNGSQRLKAKDIKQWGDIVWGAVQTNAFYGCANLQVSATDVPDLSNVTNMGQMFRDCQALITLDVSSWDVSSVTNMQQFVQGCTSLTTLDVSGWNVSSVTNMALMFHNCQSLSSLDVSGWDVSSVTNMGNMFQNCQLLTTLDVSAWDVSGVTSFDGFLQFCYNFITDIDFSDPITGSISLITIRGMMAGTKSERLLLQAGNLQSPVNIAGNPSNWIASPNMKEVKLFGMKNDVDTTIGFGSAGAMTGEAWLDLLESFDISQSSIYKLSPTAYSDMEAHLQGLGYIDIADYLTQTNNNWTVIS